MTVITPTKTTTDSTTEQATSSYKLKDNSVFWVNWYTTSGPIDCGTATYIHTDLCNKPILITANDIFVDHDPSIPLEDFILNGDFIDISTNKVSEASISEVIPLNGSTYSPDLSQDLSAFFLNNDEELQPFSLSRTSCTPSDTIYLLTNTCDNSTEFVYPCSIISTKDGILYYKLDQNNLSNKVDLSYSIGAPLVNEDGELVGIHIGSNGSTRCGLTSQQIYTILKNNL